MYDRALVSNGGQIAKTVTRTGRHGPTPFHHPLKGDDRNEIFL